MDAIKLLQVSSVSRMIALQQAGPPLLSLTSSWCGTGRETLIQGRHFEDVRLLFFFLHLDYSKF